MTDLQFQFRISQPSISFIIRHVCKAISQHVKPICFPEFSERFWLEIATEFYDKTNFPHCLGAIDGKHIRVVKPEASGSLYYNYKNYFSILLLAVCDASYKFLFVDIGAYGKSADCTVFKESVFFKKLQNNMLKIPPPKVSFTGMTEPMPFVFVADEGFGLSTHVLRPYSGKCLNVKKRVFNYRLCRARRNIECSFGILTNKWRILHRPLNVDLTLCEDIIKVCCILHNFVRDRDGFQIEEILTVEGLFDVEYGDEVRSKKATKLRDTFADYFVSEEGALPWQMDRI
ncbi:uncharacterized protein [Anabrus simplex]|uniref:uncharacterized protein n=1 Tax=Anabrus simplex TaxID=316456 RepID=UPI0035A2F868